MTIDIVVRCGGTPTGCRRGIRPRIPAAGPVRRDLTAELGTAGVVLAELAQPGLLRSEIAGRHGRADRLPDRAQGALEAEQFVVVRAIDQLLPVGEVHQLQAGRHHPAGAQDRERIELHLEQRLGLVGLARDRPVL